MVLPLTFFLRSSELFLVISIMLALAMFDLGIVVDNLDQVQIGLKEGERKTSGNWTGLDGPNAVKEKKKMNAVGKGPKTSEEYEEGEERLQLGTQLVSNVSEGVNRRISCEKGDQLLLRCHLSIVQPLEKAIE
jgi:hypothetical protein